MGIITCKNIVIIPYMNLFRYTLKLRRKIKYYDNLAQISYMSAVNPFAIPKDKKIIWIEEKRDDT